MDTKIDHIIHNLRIIAQIPRNGRIRKSTQGRISLETNSYLMAVRRFYNQDSRTQAILDIKAVFDEAFAAIDGILSHKYMTHFKTASPPVTPMQPPTQGPPIQTWSSSPLAQSPTLDDPFRLSYTPSQPIPIPMSMSAPPRSHGYYSAEYEDERRRLLNRLCTVYKDLLRAVEGVTSLKISTYTDDIVVTTHLDRLIEKVHFCIQEINNKIPADILAQYSVSPKETSILDQM